MKRIVSVNDLAWRLGIPRAHLEHVADNIEEHYREWASADPKRSHHIRMLRSPSEKLMVIQRLLLARVFHPIPLNDIVHGGLRGRSPRSNAARHLGQRCVVTIDVKQFYDRVRHKVVYRLFCKELGFGRDVARLLTRLTTFNDCLPQGAPTSLAVANLLLSSTLDSPLATESKRLGVNATRFVDDTALSGDNPRPFINGVARKLSRRRLPVHRAKANGKSKLKIMPNSGPQEITGLLVNRVEGPSISRAKRDRVRAAIHQLPRRPAEERSAAVRSINGRIQHVRQFNQGTAERLERFLREMLRVG